MPLAALLAANLAALPIPTGKYVEIAPGVLYPSINLGTCCGSDPKVGIPAWLKDGGGGIDTSNDYSSTGDIAGTLVGTPRASYFMTSKVHVHGVTEPLTAEYAMRQVQLAATTLGVSQLDLMLIHHPASDTENVALWKGLEQAVAANLTRAVGLSNFNQKQIEAILSVASVRPTVNQCDLSVGGQDTQCGPRDEAIAYNRAQNISYEAWSPMKNCPFSDKTMVSIASGHNVSVSQVCLRWILERGCTIAVGTGSEPDKVAAYTRENLDLFGFALTAAEVREIDQIATRSRSVEEHA